MWAFNLMGGWMDVIQEGERGRGIIARTQKDGSGGRRVEKEAGRRRRTRW